MSKETVVFIYIDINIQKIEDQGCIYFEYVIDHFN